jgi:hypothetical protein
MCRSTNFGLVRQTSRSARNPVTSQEKRKGRVADRDLNRMQARGKAVART